MSGEGGKPVRPAVVRPVPVLRPGGAGAAPVAVAQQGGREPAPARPPTVAQPAAPARPPAGARRPAARLEQAQPTLDDVRACYRLILGREAESDEVLQRHLAQVSTLAQLRDAFLHSAEFRSRALVDPTPRLHLAPAPLAIDVTASAEVLAAMLARTATYWERVGAEAPHWSVLTQDRYRPDAIGQSIDDFYATGRADLGLVEGLLTRQGISPESLHHCVEFGCGVGRATLTIARLFDRVTGCDISRPHLALAAEQAAARIVDNVAWHHATVSEPMPPGGWDCWYSRLVLQHNPPPVAAHLLRRAFAGLRPGGVAIFQVPTHRTDYGFSIGAYLAATAAPEMEMHVLPQPAVLALAREAGVELLEMREDTHLIASTSGLWLSNLFVFRRPAA